MKWYTDKHLWLDEKEDGTMDVGITSQGDDVMGGITYAAVEDGKVVVESNKAYEMLDVPVDGVLHANTTLPATVGWDADKSVGWFSKGYKLDYDKVMDRDAYLKACLGDA